MRVTVSMGTEQTGQTVTPFRHELQERAWPQGIMTHSIGESMHNLHSYLFFVYSSDSFHATALFNFRISF